LFKYQVLIILPSVAQAIGFPSHSMAHSTACSPSAFFKSGFLFLSLISKIIKILFSLSQQTKSAMRLPVDDGC
jgi:hypothetical protein